MLAARPDLVKTKGDGHAWEIETALMLATCPHLVQGTAPAEWPSFPKHLLVRDKRRYWPGGVWGDPGQATKEQGEAILEAEVEQLQMVIEKIEKGISP